MTYQLMFFFFFILFKSNLNPLNAQDVDVLEIEEQTNKE